jgi:glycine oxidase
VVARAESTDVIVVGGGVSGLAVANALLRAGLRVVSVFPADQERQPVASRAAGAMLGLFGEMSPDDGGIDDPGFRFRFEAQRRYGGWLDDICGRAGGSVHLARGTFVIANNVGVTDRASIRVMKERADALGEPAEFVDPEDVPGLKPNQLYGPGLCLSLPGEHAVDADELLRALSASAASFTTWSHHAESAARVRAEGAGWMLSTATGDALHAGAVVLSAGSKSWQALDEPVRREAGLPDMYFGKGVSCVVRSDLTMQSTIRTPNRAFACGIHVVPRPGGRLYIGATNNLGVDHEAEVGVQPGELHNLFDEVIHQINTDLRESRIEAVRVGFRPIVAHGRPILGKTALPGLFVSTGTYRDGVLLAPLIGAVVAADVCGTSGAVNPFPVLAEERGDRIDALIGVGMRDIVSFLQEPRGELPYDRADQLRKYLETLFRMAIDTDGAYAALRKEIQQRLQEAPLNETMNKIFYEVIAHADVVQRGEGEQP